MQPFVQEVRDGHFKMWEPPRSGLAYVLGGDVATNRQKDRGATTHRKVQVQYTDDRPDYSSGTMIELQSGRHVASWHGFIDTDEFAIVLAAMGLYYNGAHLVPEATGPGFAVIDSLVKVIRYPNVYRSKVFGTDTDDPVTSGYGFNTTEVSRPMLIQRVFEVLNANQCFTEEVELIAELRTLQYDAAGKPRAMGRDKDDRVFSYALSLQGRYELLYGRMTNDPIKDETTLTPYDRKVWDFVRSKIRASERRKKRGGDFVRRDVRSRGGNRRRTGERVALQRRSRP